MPINSSGKQIEDGFDSLMDSSAEKGHLLLELRRFYISESSANLTEKGYCNFRANLYRKEGKVYVKLASIDSQITWKNIAAFTFQESVQLPY